MIKLYFDKQLVDIKEDIDVSLTYEMNDLSNPQAVKSSYSKTVTLEGTPTNNTIFSHIYKLDKDIVDSNTSLLGLNFNPNKRVPYYIELNGEVIDSGYFQLDNITSNEEHIQYEVTLYGGIGDFFYNLMYDEEEENKNLGSLYYGINGMTKEQEDKNENLFEYDKNYVKECWIRRTTPIYANNLTNSQYEMFCPIPTHSGTYDDFSADTILTNESSGGIPLYIEDKESDDKTVRYTKSYGFSKLTMPRELSEWEIGDLRSHYQRLGIRLQSIYDAIKNPINNGGYTVDDSQLDEHSKEYIAKGYVMLDRFDYDTINETNKVINITLSQNPIQATINNKNIAYSQIIDVSNFVNPHVTVSIIPEIKCYTTTGDSCATIFAYGNQQLRQTEIHHFPQPHGDPMETADFDFFGTVCMGSWQIYYVRYVDINGNSLGITTPIIYGSWDSNNMVGDNTQFRGEIEWRLTQEVAKYFPEYNYNPYTVSAMFNWKYYLGNDTEIKYQKNTNIGANVGQDFVAPENITIETSLPKNTAQIRVECLTVGTRFIYDAYYKRLYSRNPAYGIYPKKPDGSTWNNINEHVTFSNFEDWDYFKPLKHWNVTEPIAFLNNQNVSGYNAYGYINNTSENITQIYDGAIASSSRRHVLNKKQIFADTDTPFDYLISIGKTFNWIFEKDVISDTIRIYSKYNYYDKEVKDITYDVDKQSYQIKPSTLEYNKYLMNINVPETYQSELFKKKNNRLYSQFIYKPNYQFNSESLEVLEDSKLTLGLPYTMHSIYFSPVDNRYSPKATMGNKFTVTLWNDTENKSIDKDYRGMMLTTNSIVDSNDLSDKLCCFDKDNSNVSELKNTIVLYNGAVSNFTNTNQLWLSNDAMIIDQLCGGNAYIQTLGRPVYTRLNSTEQMVIQEQINVYPSFTNVSDSGYSLLFNEEGNTKNLWKLFFKNDITNIYNKDSKVLTIKYKLKEQPYKALRHFYYIDNSIWILNKITDYNPNNEDFTECEFIKILDKDNFCKSEV